MFWGKRGAPLQAGYEETGSGAGVGAGDGMGIEWDGDGAGGQKACMTGRRQKGTAIPVSARDQELDLLRPNLAVLQQQVSNVLGHLHRLCVIWAAEENPVSFSAHLLAIRFVHLLLLRLVLF